MYYIMVYDVNVKRVNKMLKLLRKYLNWVQNSVFEGELSDSQLERLKHEIKDIIKSNEDSVIIYAMESKWLARDIIGLEKKEIGTII
ncbi:MAG TPA: CRISPR-associated endonuclease Cas2 [Thermodesulfobacteriota bacterium]|nr:CRISPR-associated endonuclease Cas2 [Thermodesulfobacteriota bacterium]